MKATIFFNALLFSALSITAGSTVADQNPDAKMLERGRYILMTSGCNDCHTPGYPEQAGNIPQQDWVTGNPVGFQGPWGTTYPANLRLKMQNLTKDQWMGQARSARRPPMPWFMLRDMTDYDLKSIYHFIRSLGPKGKPAPAYVPPGQPAATPYIEFFPKNPPQQHASR
ncbi:MAG TPA: cytochrome C [Gammaproteobacteria bacterium]|nr:cytochrome C [Gammaproteobacteria bacterium]